MPIVINASTCSALHSPPEVNSENQQFQPLNQHLDSARNATGAKGLERGEHLAPAQPLTQLKEKLLEVKNLTENKENSVNPAFSKTNILLVKHDSISASNSVQGQGVEEPDGPARALRTKGTVSVGDAQRVASSVMILLEKAYPKYLEKLETSHRLLAHINKMQAGVPCSNNDLHIFYSFFKRAEDITSQLGVMNRLTKESLDTMDLSRIMKWHFRSGLTAQIKEALDLKLNDRLAYIEQGGSRTNDFGIKYAQSLDPAGVVGATVQVSNKQSLSSTPAGEISARSGIEFSVGVELLSGLAELGLNFGTAQTKKYANLADYVSANSAKLGAWFSESKFTTLSNISEIIKLASNYEKDIFYVNISRPFLMDKLSAISIDDVKTEPVACKIRPAEVHYTQYKAVTGQASISCFLAVSGNLSISQETGTKNKRMDLVDMMTASNDVALALTNNKGTVKDGSALVQSMRDHSRLHSAAVTTAILRGENFSVVKAKIANCKHSASQIMADYVVSKAAKKVDIDCERTIQSLLSDHSMLLRPESLKIYEISTPIKRNVCSATVNVTDPLKLLDAKAQAKLISVLQHDDPYCLGEYIELELAGEIKTMDGLGLLVNTLLNSMGKPSPSLAELPSSLGGAALHQSHGASSTTLLKVKDGTPMMLVQQTFKTAHDDSSVTIPTTPGSSVKLMTDAAYKLILSETLGTETLDFILPIARKKMKDNKLGENWDTYVAAHINDFKQLIQNIASPDTHRLLNSELETISQNNSLTQSICALLIESATQAKQEPTDENYRVAISHFKDMLGNYIVSAYNKNVLDNWNIRQA